MLDELIRSNAVDKRWAEAMIAGAASLEDLERAAIGIGLACGLSGLGQRHSGPTNPARGAPGLATS